MEKQPKLIDLSYLNSIADGNKEIINELIDIFIEQVPEFTQGLDEYYKNKQWLELGGLAHKAKSSVIAMGMEEMGNVDLKNLELLAKKRQIEAIESQTIVTIKEQEILDRLSQNILAYDKNRQIWVQENDNDGTFKQIINKFVTHCEDAINELKFIKNS